MHIVYDGIIFETQSQGGISRAFEELIPRICDLAPEAQVDLYYAKPLRRALPKHVHLCEHSLVPLEYLSRVRQSRGRLRTTMRELLLSAVSHSSKSVWHSTYYTQPKAWRGRKALTVYDMTHELYPDMFPSKGHERFRRRKKQQIAEADVVFCISDATRQDIHNLYGTSLEKLQCVHLAYNAACFYREAEPTALKNLATSELPTEKLYLLYVGVRKRYKNFSTFLTAYSQWRYRNEVDLVVVGPSWESDEVDDLQAKKVDSQVHLLSSIDDQQLRILYNAAVAFVYPSLYEGFGLPLLEAMACGCPIVASRIPSSIEIAQDYPIYFSPTSEEELQDALSRVVEEDRKDLFQQKAAEILSNFSWQKSAQSYLDIYARLL